jgi:tetratricopeptide (TPR) repeat protein
MRAEVMVRRMVLVLVAAGALVACATVGGEAPAAGTVAERAPDVLALVAQANLRLELGEVSEGVQLFRQAVGQAPGDGQLREEFGLALARVGLFDEARAELARVPELSAEGDAVLGITLARGAKDDDDLEKAVPHLEKGLASTVEGDQARYQLVDALIRLDRGKDAWAQLQPLLGDQPDNPRLQLLAGEALRLQGMNDEAIDYLKKAEGAAETRTRAATELVQALEQKGDYAAAAAKWKELLDREGSNLARLTHYALLLARAGEREQAMSTLDEVLRGDPNFVDALTLKAAIASAEGKTDLAEQLYRHTLAVKPDDASVMMALGRLLLDLHRLDEARKLFDAVGARVEAGKLPAEAGLEVAQEEAALELLDRKPEQALPWLEKLSVSSLDRRTVAEWGEYFRQRQAYAEGLVWLRAAALGDDPLLMRMRDALEAEFLFAAGEDEAARELLAPMLAGKDDAVSAALGVLERQKRYDEMVAAARAALERLGDAPGVKFALAAGLERSGHWEEAVVEFRALLTGHPDNAAALNYLGYMFADRGVHLDEALTLIEKAVKLEPTSGAYLDSLGWVYFRLGDLDPAEKYLTEAVALEPNDATVHEHLGDLFRARGNTAKAADHYRRALAIGPEEPGQKERLEEKAHAVEGHASP